ncbi:MAG: hypothetical protein VKP62_10890 [Candidatus Sericytochromatia bacterium]|nr:hypothetical protein [Candidatus Sericytochromatia bacterium]
MCLLAVAGLLAGCPSTTLRAVHDPDYVGRTYERLVVSAPDVTDFEKRATIEDIYARSLVDEGFRGQVWKHYALFPPTRTQTPEAIAKSLSERGIEARLEVRIPDSGATRSYVPRSNTTTSTTETRKQKNATVRETRVTSNESGGYHVYTPWMKIEVRLVDLNRQGVAWLGSSSVQGTASGSETALYETQADAVSRKLIADKVIQGPKSWF